MIMNNYMNSRSTFKDFYGKNPRFSKMVIIKETKRVVAVKAAKVYLTVTFNEFLFPPSFKCKSKRFIGSSRCHEGDDFDERRGLDLAEHKARMKAYNYIAKVFKDNAAMYNHMAYDCNQIAAKAIRKKDRQYNCFLTKGEVAL